MTFDDFLRRRRLDVAAFRAAEPARAAEWETWYAQLHPDSFLLQVKMVLNDVRRRYHLAEASPPPPAAEGAALRPSGRRARPIGPLTEILDPAVPLADPNVLRAEASGPPKKDGGLPSDPKTPPFLGEGLPSDPKTPPFLGEARGSDSNVLGSDPKVLGSAPETAPPKPVRPRAIIRRPAPTVPPEQGAEADPDSPPTTTETGIWRPATTGSAVPDGAPVPPQTADHPGPDVPEATPGRPEAGAAEAFPTKMPRPQPLIRRPPPSPETSPDLPPTQP